MLRPSQNRGNTTTVIPWLRSAAEPDSASAPPSSNHRRQQRAQTAISQNAKRGFSQDRGNATTVIPWLHAADETDSAFAPPLADDGTPSDSIDDVFVRVRQVGS